jgi:hypothetical protein
MGSLRTLWQISKEKKMKNKKILLGMLVLALTFGMTVIGCDDNTEDNRLKGSWTGTFTPDGGKAVDATMEFTSNEWTLTTESKTLKGTYTTTGKSFANLKMGSELGNIDICTATEILDGLILGITSGDNNKGAGTFSRVKIPPADPFTGNWSGKYTPTGGLEVAATFTLSDDLKWTLKTGSIDTNGTYTKSKIGITATLKYQGITIGSAALVNPLELDRLKKKLRVDIINVDNINGSGTFTRPATTE